MRFLVLFFLFIGTVINFADKSMIGFVSKEMMEELQLSLAAWGVIGSSFFWIFPIAAIVISVVAKQKHAKTWLSFMFLSWSVLQIAGGLYITGFTTLLIYRILLGIAEGGYAPVGIHFLFQYFPIHMWARVTAIFASGSIVGSYMLSPVIIFFAYTYSWRTIFIWMGIASLILYLFWQWFIPKSTGEQKEYIRKHVAVLRVDWKELKPVLFSRTTFFTLFACFGLFFLTAWMQVWLPLYFLNTFELSNREMSLFILCIGTGALIITLSMASLSDRVFQRTQNFQFARVWITAGGLILGSFFILSLYFIHTPIWTVIALLFGYGFSNLIMSTSHVILDRQMPGKSTFLSGIIIAFQNIAAMLSPIIAGLLMDFAGENLLIGFKRTFILLFVILCSVGFLLLWIQTKKRPSI